MEPDRMTMRWSDKLAIGMGIAVGAAAIVFIADSLWSQDSINKLAHQERQQIRLILKQHAETMKELESMAHDSKTSGLEIVSKLDQVLSNQTRFERQQATTDKTSRENREWQLQYQHIVKDADEFIKEQRRGK